MSWSMGVKQLFYPSWLEGTWSVKSTFKGASFPQGNRFIGRTTPGLQKGSVIAAMPDVGAGPLSFQLRFVRSGDRVVGDRPFNYQQTVDAFLGFKAVRRVDYQPEDNPTRAAVVWATPRRDGTGEDLRKAELFINNRRGEELAVPAGQGGRPSFSCFELYRQVTQAAQQGSIGDYMVSTDFQLGPDDAHVTAKQQVAAFLNAQEALYFDAHGEAVALYEYEMTMERA